MDIVATLVLTMSVTFYLPDAGGINGDMHTADGSEARIGLAACGPRYPFGTVFEIMIDMSEYGVPQTVECRDRGGAVGHYNLDLVMRSGDLKTDWQVARAWGKRRVPVRVWRDWVHYAGGIRAERHRGARSLTSSRCQASFPIRTTSAPDCSRTDLAASVARARA